jgi:uncharacterized phage protein (TIGR02216 family)
MSGNQPASEPTFAQHAERCARVGCGVLRWTPQSFWSATPAELRTALLGHLGVFGEAEPTGFTSNELKRLMELYPDGR